MTKGRSTHPAQGVQPAVGDAVHAAHQLQVGQPREARQVADADRRELAAGQGQVLEAGEPAGEAEWSPEASTLGMSLGWSTKRWSTQQE